MERVQFIWKQPYTICTLHGAGDGVVGVGIARCSTNDHWSPKTGAKIAFLRAVQDNLDNQITVLSGGDTNDPQGQGWGSQESALKFVKKLIKEHEAWLED